MNDVWPWLALFGLGAYHGINPGMGWLFAVGLGMQEKSRRKVLAALPPIALGHALSIAAVLALLWVLQASLPERPLRFCAAAFLFGFGLYRIVRGRHPKWVGMRVGFRDLTLWSFLMASAHGAGLMLMPILIDWPEGELTEADAHMEHGGGIGSAMELAPRHEGFLSELTFGLEVVGVHTAGHLLVAGLIAVLVYEKLGLALLSRAWFNLDLLWAAVLMLSGVLILVL